MNERIRKNEEKLDRIVEVVDRLATALFDFENIKKDIIDVNKYYGSNDWFNDKNLFEQGGVVDIKAGVLSEDAVWDVDVNIKELLEKMSEILDLYKCI